MGYRYIALVDASDRGSAEHALSMEVTLREAGIKSQITLGPIKLFTADETPTVVVSGGGIIIGHIFSRDGARLSSPEQFPRFACRPQMRRHILDSCWGEYLLIQSEASAAGSVIVMRSPSPSGEVPCLYSLRNRYGFITSDISLAVLLNLYQKRVDWNFISHRLAYCDIKTRRTGLADVWELLPGCTLRLLGAEVSTEQEWSPWSFVAPDRRHSDPGEAAAELRNATASVVNAWAEADKSILLELSGGLDSSIVGACLKGTRARVVCSTLVTPVPGADERQYASLIAQHLGVDLEVEGLSFDSALFDFAPPPHFATPRIGPLQHAIDVVMASAGERHGIASFFSGGGGDAVFCYLRTAAPAADAFREHGWEAGMNAVRDISELHQCTLWKAGRLAIRKLLLTPNVWCKADRSYLDQNKVPITPEDHPWFDAPAHALRGDRERIFDLAATQAYRDSLPRGTERRMRLPLLSQPVVEACLRIPSWMWIAGGRNRSIARLAFADMLPQDVHGRRSKGSFMSYLGSVYRRNQHQMRDFLLTGHLQTQGLLDTSSLRNFFARTLPPRDRSFTRILDLCAVENWVRHQS